MSLVGLTGRVCERSMAACLRTQFMLSIMYSMLEALHLFSEANGLQVTAMALRERVPEQLAGLLTTSHPELRAAAVFTLGTLVQVHTPSSPNH